MEGSPREYTFVFADLAGFTSLTEAHGDEGGASVATRLHEIVRGALGEAQLVKTLGDGVMIAAATSEVALEVARRIAEAVAALPNFPYLRLGVHRGPAIVRDGDFFGNAVNLAARVMAAARPGQALCTEVVAEQATAAACAQTVPLGVVRLKHVKEPVGLYELTFERQPTGFSYMDPVCRMQVPAARAVSIRHAGSTIRFCSTHCADAFVADPDAYLLAPSELPAAAPGPRTV